LSQVSRLISNRELIREKYLTQNFMVEIADSLPSKDDEFIKNVRKILEDNISDADFNVNKLSNLMNISTTQLYRKLKTLTGYSPVEFMRILKLQKACGLLNQRKNTIKEVCYLVGFNNLSYFVKCFREYFGVTPAVYRDQGLIKPIKAETNE
jgi:AraC-like DNA-binding protein